MSSERRISPPHAKKSLNFGKSFKLDRNNFSTVSEWKTFCESCVLLPFRSAGGVMCDILNKLISTATCCTAKSNTNIQYVYFHHSMGSDKDSLINCM